MDQPQSSRNQMNSQSSDSSSSSEDRSLHPHLQLQQQYQPPQPQRKSITHGHTRMSTICFSHFWAIEQFSIQQELHRPCDFLVSSPFGDDRYEFVMKLFPNGKDEDNAGHLSLFLQINRCPQPRLQFRVSFSLQTAEGPRSCALNKSVVTINRSGIVTASKFFNNDFLKSHADKYLPKDVLTIGAELMIFGESETIEGPCREESEPRRKEKSKGCRKCDVRNNKDRFLGLLESGRFSDFVIVTSCGREFKTHRCVLASGSDFFSAMLNTNTKESHESRVKFNDIRGDVMDVILRQIYSLNMRCNVDELSEELLIAADRLLLVPIREQCEELLQETVQPCNVLSRLQLADRVQAMRLFHTLTAYFFRHKAEIQKTDEWTRLREENPELAARILEGALDCADQTHVSPKRARTSC